MVGDDIGCADDVGTAKCNETCVAGAESDAVEMTRLSAVGAGHGLENLLCGGDGIEGSTGDS